VHDRPREATDSFASDRSPAARSSEPSSEPSSSTSFTFHDHFEFKSLLGKTATSEAWLVRSKVSGVKYCVKRVTEAFRTTSQRETCLQEVRAVTNLPAHENVVKYHRAWQEDRHFFIQMELCERGAFGACLDRLKSMSEEERQRQKMTTVFPYRESPYVALLAERDVWRFASDVAFGLAHCHKHGVLHLDVKPDNVFIARDGVYKIGDFGVAWVAGQGWEVQDGDGGYVAPETLNLYRRSRDYGEEEEEKKSNSDPSERDGSEPTDRADVFSFGATLYEAACGERVPAEWRRGVPTWSDEDETVFETCEKSPRNTETATQTTKPRRYWDGLRFPAGRSDELRAYVSMCLRRDPTHRPSAADLAKHAAMIEKTFVSS
jgi:membrane-associated tyrosine/threonine-specific cdc2-inhibitory kinase